MSLKDSTVLVIQEHGDMDKISPLSFLISLLHQQLTKFGGNLVLTYFCGMHAISPFDTKKDEPLMLARSILTQLLAQSGYDWDHDSNGLPALSFLTPETIVKLQNGSFKTYLRVIRALLIAFAGSYDAIFVVLDGIEYYNRRWESEIRQVLRAMMKGIKSFE